MRKPQNFILFFCVFPPLFGYDCGGALSCFDFWHSIFFYFCWQFFSAQVLSVARGNVCGDVSLLYLSRLLAPVPHSKTRSRNKHKRTIKQGVKQNTSTGAPSRSGSLHHRQSMSIDAGDLPKGHVRATFTGGVVGGDEDDRLVVDQVRLRGGAVLLDHPPGVCFYVVYTFEVCGEEWSGAVVPELAGRVGRGPIRPALPPLHVHAFVGFVCASYIFVNKKHSMLCPSLRALNQLCLERAQSERWRKTLHARLSRFADSFGTYDDSSPPPLSPYPICYFYRHFVFHSGLLVRYGHHSDPHLDFSLFSPIFCFILASSCCCVVIAASAV